MVELVANKPLSVGDLIGRSIRYYRVNVPLFFHALIWPTVISIVGKVALQWGITIFAQKSWDLWVPALIAILLGFIVSVTTTIFLTARNLAFVRLCNGFASNYADAYKFCRSKIGTIIGLAVIGYVMLVGALGLWGIEFVISAVLFKPDTPLVGVMFALMLLGAIGMIFTCFVFTIVGLVVMSIAACEDKGFGTLISRGFSLSFNDFWRSVLFGLLLFMTISVISYPLSLPAVGLSFFEVFRHGLTSTSGDPTRMPLYVLALTQTWESLVNMLLWPVIWLAYGQFYYDLRVRQEGLDVIQSLKLLEEANPAQ